MTKRGGFGCGFAGYNTIQFKNMPELFKKNLRYTYDHLRKDHPKRVEITEETKLVEKDGEEVEVPTGKKIECEINGFSLLLYNASFDWNRHRIGVKYNERWVDEIAQFGHNKDHVRLENLVGTARSMMVDWRDGPLVKPLQATLPPIFPYLTGGVISTPIRISGKIRAIILWAPEFESVFNREQWVSFFVVTENSLIEFRYENGKWNSTEIVISASP